MNQNIKGLPILATLTSFSEALNEADIEAAAKALGSYLSHSEPEVMKEIFLFQFETYSFSVRLCFL